MTKMLEFEENTSPPGYACGHGGPTWPLRATWRPHGHHVGDPCCKRWSKL